MNEFKPASSGVFSPDEFPPSPQRIYECAYSGRIDAWGHDGDSFLLGYIDATYNAMLAGGMEEKNAAKWMSHAIGAAVKGGFEKNIERSKLEMMMGVDPSILIDEMLAYETCGGCRFDGRQDDDVTPCDNCARSFDDRYEECKR